MRGEDRKTGAGRTYELVLSGVSKTVERSKTEKSAAAVGRKQVTIVYEVKNGLYVNLTNRCPCACVFCIRNNADGAYGSDSLWLEREPDADEIMAAVAAARPERFAEIVFCGYGEPTERLDVLLDAAGRIKRAYPNLPVRVNTNGLADLIAGGSVAAKFKGLVDSLSISLNAADAEEYAALCRPKFGIESYAAILRFAEDAKRYVPSVVMTVVAAPGFTDEKLAACRAVCERIGVPLRVRVYEA